MRIPHGRIEANRFREVMLDEPGLFPAVKQRRTRRILEWCESMMQRAKKARHYAVARCNYELSKRQLATDEANELEITKLATYAGVTVTSGGDPRGYVVHLLLPSGRHNTMGGAEHGYGVPDPC